MWFLIYSGSKNTDFYFFFLYFKFLLSMATDVIIYFIKSLELWSRNGNFHLQHPGMTRSGTWQSPSPRASRATSHLTSLRWPQWRLNRTSHRKLDYSSFHTYMLSSERREVVSSKFEEKMCICAAGGFSGTFLETMPWGFSSLLETLRAPSWFERVRQPKVILSF